MIVIAIVGILVSVALPGFVKYSNKARYTEVIAASVKYKQTAEVAVQMGFVLTDLNAGSNGIPEPITPSNSQSTHLKSLTIENGVIKAVGADHLDNAVFQLDATLKGDGINWSLNGTASTCLALGLCSPI